MTNYREEHPSISGSTHESLEAEASPKLSASKRLFILATCFFVMVVAAIPLMNTWIQTHEYQAKFEEAKKHNQQAVEANRQVQAQYQKVNDPAYLEEVARRDYYYSKDGEIIFVLPEDAEESAS